jgi:hypothetical protein
MPRSSVMTAKLMPDRSRRSSVIPSIEVTSCSSGFSACSAEAWVAAARTSGSIASVRAVASAFVSVTSVTVRAPIHANTPVTRARITMTSAS